MRMKYLVALVAVFAVAQSGAARADDITLTLDNRSAQSIVGLYATPKGEAAVSETNLVTGGIAASQSGEITIAATADSSCVFDLRIAFGDGSNIDRPDVDLCQTDALIIN